MLRWSYLVPRLVALLAITAAIYYGANPLIRFALVQAGQAATGAKVEIGAVNGNLLLGDLRLEQLAVADPEHPERNLLEVGRAAFTLDPRLALHRKLVIREGSLEEIVLYTERENSGALEKSEEPTAPSAVDQVVADLESRGSQWLDQSLGQLEDDARDDLKTVQLGREYAERWPREYEAIETQAKQIEGEVRQIRDTIKQVADKPLDHLDKIKPLTESIDKARRDSTELQARVRQLHEQMKHDREALDIARQHDLEYVRQRLRLDDLDGNSLSEYLLGPVWGPRIEGGLRWLQRTREELQQNESEQLARASRGVNVLFPGIPASADVVVQKLNLSGRGTVNALPFTFVGAAHDLTHQPRRHGTPTTIAVRTDGAIQMTARGTLDRRGDQPTDQWVVDVPAWKQNGETLGKPGKLAVQIAPGTARVHAELVIRDRELQGKITVIQDQLQLQPLVPERYAKFVSPQNLQAAVAGIQQLQAELLVSGDILKPRYELRSNLGPQLATGLNQAVRQELAAREQQLLAKADSEVKEELDKLQEKLAADHGKILERLEVGDEQMQQIRTLLTARIGSPSDLLKRGKKLLK